MSRLIKSSVWKQEETRGKVISIRMMESGEPSEDHVPLFTHTEAEREKILTYAKQEAHTMLSEAEEEARRIREQIHYEQHAWEQDKAALIQEAKDAGFAIGMDEGRKQGYEEYRQQIQLARETVEASQRDYYSHLEASEKVILELGIKVAGKIIGKKISGDEDDFLSLVKRALKNAREYQSIQLHTSPGHYQFLLENKEDLIAIFPKEIDFYIFPDEELAEDACIIESENGRIDACVDSQLEEIKQKLAELLESEQS